jgi:hypothetical protein
MSFQDNIIASYLGKFSGVLNTINKVTKNKNFSVSELINKIILENNIDICSFLPSNIKDKTIIDISCKLIEKNNLMLETLSNFFIFDYNNNPDDSEELKSLKQEKEYYKFLYNLPVFLSGLNSNDKKELIKIFKYPIERIIEKDIKILTLNLSATLINLKNTYSNKEIEQVLLNINFILGKFLLVNLKDISIPELIKFYELQNSNEIDKKNSVKSIIFKNK